MSDLRPIGTEFEIFREPDHFSTNCDGHYYRYRVIAHHDVMPYWPSTYVRKSERIECIDIRPRKVAYYAWPDLHPVYVDEVSSG